MSESLLRLTGVATGYGDVRVLRELDLEVDAGQIVALLGANGVGKTTTLSTISGLIRPLGGVIELFGTAVEPGKWPRTEVGRRARSGLAHVPEDRSLFSGLSVRNNLALGVSWRERHAAIERAISLFPPLESCLDRKAGLLSGGQQQMLAIARALVARPALVMIDELSLGLAPIVVKQLLPVLRTVADEEGTGFLLVEQHIPLVLEVADHAVVLARGTVAASCSAEALAADPSIVAAAYLNAD